MIRCLCAAQKPCAVSDLLTVHVQKLFQHMVEHLKEAEGAGGGDEE